MTARVRMPSGWLSLPSVYDEAARMNERPVSTRAWVRACHKRGEYLNVSARRVVRHEVFVERGMLRVRFWSHPSSQELWVSAFLGVLAVWAEYARWTKGGAR